MIIFVGGIHGAGKSYLCQKAAVKTGYAHFTASELIKLELKSGPNWSLEKLTPNLELNQKLLISAMEKVRSKNENILLDGHYTLYKATGELVAIDRDIFTQIGVDKFVLIETSLKKIESRLKARGIVDYDEQKIINHSLAERQHVVNLAAMIGVSLTILNEPQVCDIQNIIKTGKNNREP